MIRAVRCTVIIIGIIVRTVIGIKIMRTKTMFRKTKDGGMTRINGMMKETVTNESKMTRTMIGT